MPPHFARVRPADLPPFKERLIALRLAPRFLRMVWSARPLYAAAIVCFRVLLAFSPVVQLWIGKLIIDAVVANIGAAAPDWTGIFLLVALELAVALVSDVLQRASNLLESLLGDLFGNRLSVRIMEHAATLDLENFEDPDFYDSLERARRQTAGRIGLLAVLLGIGQSMLTLISLLAVLIAFNGWLLLMLVLAVLPSFIGETHFAGLSYSLLYRWTPERRELDYLRYVGTSDVTAKEVKLFGLSDYFTRKYERLADEFYEANRALSIKRAATSGGAHRTFDAGVLRGEHLHHCRHGARDPHAGRPHLPGGLVPTESQPDQRCSLAVRRRLRAEPFLERSVHVPRDEAPDGEPGEPGFDPSTAQTRRGLRAGRVSVSGQRCLGRP